jgi:L-glyceraldehyde 3-phosphate reductase
MLYRPCGVSGLKLPALSLGAWETFGGYRGRDVARECLYAAFDLGITHFDFANNYGTPPGNAEVVCGEILKDLPRDELIVSSKAGYRMWPGPYGDGGSRKYLVASCDQSLRRMGLEYFDIFYSHRPDPTTPIEETIGALDQLVRQGKALYAGVSNYNGEQFGAALAASAALGGPRILVHQPHYNLLARGIETDLLPRTTAAQVGVIAYGPLASGVLTGKYLAGEIPAESRAGARWGAEWVTGSLTEERRRVLLELDTMARARGQTLAQMALAWVVRQETITSALIGVSRVEQLRENVAVLANLDFSASELRRIDTLTA